MREGGRSTTIFTILRPPATDDNGGDDTGAGNSPEKEKLVSEGAAGVETADESSEPADGVSGHDGDGGLSKILLRREFLIIVLVRKFEWR